jgi:hypothetical protein
MATHRRTLFLQADVAEAPARGAVGRCPAAFQALNPGK